MADQSYSTKVYIKQGGDQLVVASGGSIKIETGGSIIPDGGTAPTVTALTDNSTGVSGGNTIAAVTTFPTAANAIATLAAKQNAVIAALAAMGITL